MDFAPYQDTAPERSRELSPPPQPSTSLPANPRSPPPTRPNAFTPSTLPPPSHFHDERQDIESGRLNVNLFETSLPMRLDYEAILAYMLLPPAGGVFLLVMEHKSDYVRWVWAKGGGVLVSM